MPIQWSPDKGRAGTTPGVFISRRSGLNSIGINTPTAKLVLDGRRFVVGW